MEENEVIGLEWDDEIDDGEEFERVLFEPGDYKFEVLNVEREVTKTTGNNMAALELKVTDGKKSAVVRDWIVLTNKTIWKIASFFRSVGLKKHGEKVKMQWKKALGLTGELSLKTEERTSSKGTTYTVNVVDAYLDPPEEVEDVTW